MECSIFTAVDFDCGEHLPGSAEIDNHRAFRNGKGNRDTALGGRCQRVGDEFSFVCSTLGQDCVRSGKQPARRQGRDLGCQTECRRSLEQFSSIHNVLSLLFMMMFSGSYTATTSIVGS